MPTSIVTPEAAKNTPSALLREIIEKDLQSVKELNQFDPTYEASAGLLELHERMKQAIAINDEMVALLRSACCIAIRKGESTNWDFFETSLRNLGITGVTARTYRKMPS